MEKLLEILNEINPNVDYENAENLIDGNLIDSMSVLSLVSEIEDAFDIEITPVDLVPANFNSAKAMWKMIERLQNDND